MDFSLLSWTPGALCSSAAEPDTFQMGHLQWDALQVPLCCPRSMTACSNRGWDSWGDLSMAGAAVFPGGGGVQLHRFGWLLCDQCPHLGTTHGMLFNLLRTRSSCQCPRMHQRTNTNFTSLLMYAKGKRRGKGSALCLEGEERALEWMGKLKGTEQFSKNINNY